MNHGNRVSGPGGNLTTDLILKHSVVARKWSASADTAACTDVWIEDTIDLKIRNASSATTTANQPQIFVAIFRFEGFIRYCLVD
jgi:hypothetical protein